MRLLRVASFTAALVALAAGVGLFQVRQRHAAFERNAAAIEGRLLEARAQLDSARAEHAQLKAEFDCRLTRDGMYGLGRCAFCSYPPRLRPQPFP
ncbi:MAG: hypothetical protein QM765_15890 [Myxococcales bacterium]